jgi:hypothetical protein
MLINNCIFQRAVLLFKGALFVIAPVLVFSASGAKELAPVEASPSSRFFSVGWQELCSEPGKCSMMFPCAPKHVSEKLTLSEAGHDLKYDAYISSTDGKHEVFMLLVAGFPDFVDESYAKENLKGFLNGILTCNPNNQLLFAKVGTVYGNEALDFFIRTGSVYFQGRAIMINNSLYLIAMECEIIGYDAEQYEAFVSSFKLHSSY